MKPILAFEAGTLTLSGMDTAELPEQLRRFLRLDERPRNYRGSGCADG